MVLVVIVIVIVIVVCGGVQQKAVRLPAWKVGKKERLKMLMLMLMLT